MENSAYWPGGGIYNGTGFFGSQPANGVMDVTDSTFAYNVTSNSAGGGINNNSIGNVTGSVFYGNSAFGAGGGIYNGGTLSVINSTLYSNTAPTVNGGAISNGGALNLTNGTLADNSMGGGVINFGTLTVTNSTIVGNQPAGITVFGQVTLRNTIVANNASDNCWAAVIDGGVVIDGGHNLDSANSCGFSIAMHSAVNTNPLLGSLQINPPGQAIPTMALLQGSPAIDGAEDAACPLTDERGVARPAGAHCDIGSFEFVNEAVPLPITPPKLASPTEGIVIDFSVPVITSTIHFAISPTVHFTVTWSARQQISRQAASTDRVTISHAPFATGVSYALHILPGGQAESGIPVAERTFGFAYYRYRIFLPSANKH
jgi:hypothetical protein